LDSYDDELEAMDRGKVGHPYRLMDRYVEFLAVVRYLFFRPYRQLEGFIGLFLGFLQQTILGLGGAY